MTINAFLTEDVRTIKVFNQFGVPMNVNFFDVDLKEICESRGIDSKLLFAALDKIINKTNRPVHDYDNWELGFLMDYISNTHHKYSKTTLPILIAYAKKIDRECNTKLVMTKSILNACFKFKNLLFGHMEKEEKILFPYIRTIQKKTVSGGLNDDQKGLIKSILVLKQEHNEINKMMQIIENLLIEYSKYCLHSDNYNSLVFKLKECKEDMIVHHHIENNILFRKALLIEKQRQYN